MLCSFWCFFWQIWITVIYNPSIPQFHNPCRILLSKLRVMRHHNHQPIFSNLFQQFHDLDTGFAVQRPGRFVRQKHFRVIYQGTGNRYPLHLPAGHLVWFFVKLIPQAHFLQCFPCPLPAVISGNTANRQSQLHIGKDCLMGNQVVALEHKADSMVSVSVPVTVFIFSRGNTVDNQLPGVVTVKTAYHIQKCSFS